ncbi:U4/U6 small nuclear ribonucleoprotein PRP4-like protein-like [Hibiscus syriacus]|uniref:U4/U6 small nuclear ribonucleoprotein PRP4-like protein-like n=1 Tax=Hibiscus syriacus TaxID=106335 RepID=A0A6A3ADG0_HIBSY|nr:uncharacterized protein LOC120128595 [Hibiscus syriacus]KAE8702621.1 U4/U6 small nuclear ribonucleoprotein PRP4-like protein-like [Hibiscus syriacus]
MNNNRRRQKGEIHHQGMQGTRSYSRKPSPATWQPAVPTWEKKFCTLVGSVPWWKLLETKRFMYLYDNVVQWNDSAGEEAFHNAKNRFWAEINGLPCDIRLPDPDSYIDKIDWDSEIDPELLLDLEREPKVPDEKDKSEHVVILGNFLLLNQPFVCGGGWGDAEEGAVKENNMSSSNWKNKDYENSWEPNNGNMKDTGYGNCWNNSWEWNQRGNNCNDWDNNDSSYVDYNRTGDWGTWDVTGRKREDADQYMSRYKTTRFHDNSQNNRRWRNPRGRQRTNFAYERPSIRHSGTR